MSKTIALHIQKGGVGKSTLSVSLASQLAKSSKVLLIDCDPQGNATSWLHPDQLEYDLADFLLKNCELGEVIQPTTIQNLNIIPTAGTGGDLGLFRDTKGVQEPFFFRNLLKAIKPLNYDYIIADMPPGFGVFERNIIVYCDEVLTPIIADANGIDALQSFSAHLQQAKSEMDTEKPAYSKLIVNQFNRSIAMNKDYVAELQKELQDQFQIYIVPVDQVFSKARAANQSIFENGTAKKETVEILEKLAADL